MESDPLVAEIDAATASPEWKAFVRQRDRTINYLVGQVLKAGTARQPGAGSATGGGAVGWRSVMRFQTFDRCRPDKHVTGTTYHVTGTTYVDMAEVMAIGTVLDTPGYAFLMMKGTTDTPHVKCDVERLISDWQTVKRGHAV